MTPTGRNRGNRCLERAVQVTNRGGHCGQWNRTREREAKTVLLTFLWQVSEWRVRRTVQIKQQIKIKYQIC